MKKLFHCALVLIMIVSFTTVKAQNVKESQVNNQSSLLKEDAVKARQRKQQVDQTKNKKVLSQSKADSSPIDENDAYMGRKAEFLNNLTINDLPIDFPKYDKSYGLKYYNNLVDNYYSAHRDILKPSVRNKIDHSFPSGNDQKFNTK